MRRMSLGAMKVPRKKPRKSVEPMRPSVVSEKPSRLPRSATTVFEQAGAAQEQGDAAEQGADRDEDGDHERSSPAGCHSRVREVAARME